MINCRHLLLIFILFFLGVMNLYSQESALETAEPIFLNPFIAYVGQLPDEDKVTLRESFGKRMINFLIGKKYENMVSKPVAVYTDEKEETWILDQGNLNLVRFKDGVGDMPQFKSKKYESFPSLVGICAYKKEKILFTDSYHNQVFFFTPGKKELSVLNDTVRFDRPTGIAYNAVYKQIWILETGAHRICILDENGALIKRFGVRGAEPGQFNFPTSIWIDHSGKVFIVDAMNFRVQVFSLDGMFLSMFGKQGDATGYFARPKGIATDSEGNIYVVDALFNSVQIFDIKGNYLENFGSQGREEGEFWMPTGIYIDDRDYIYVADTYNSRVQVFRFTRDKKE